MKNFAFMLYHMWYLFYCTPGLGMLRRLHEGNEMLCFPLKLAEAYTSVTCYLNAAEDVDRGSRGWSLTCLLFVGLCFLVRLCHLYHTWAISLTDRSSSFTDDCDGFVSRVSL